MRQSRFCLRCTWGLPVSKPNILVVDDEPSIALALCARLKAFGFRVDKALSGQAALNFVQRQCPDVILLDLRMAGMDGQEVLEILKDDASTDSIPVIMLSAHAGDAERSRSLQSGAFAFLNKPYDPEQLHETIRAALGGTSTTDETAPGQAA